METVLIQTTTLFIVDRSKRAASGTWESSEQKEKVVDWSWLGLSLGWEGLGRENNG